MKQVPGSIAAIFVLGLLAPNVSAADEARPRNAFNKRAYGHLKEIILKSAEKMSEADYAFKPVEGVRSFGQVLGHVADSNNFFCTLARGEKYTSKNIEKTKTSKADLIPALKEAFAFCDKTHEGMTDAVGAEMVTFMKEPLAKLDALTVNNMHTIEHYGNLVTYLRMKGHVPPSTENMQAPAANPTPSTKPTPSAYN